MNRIEKAFTKGKAFIGFLTAGDPSMEKTEEFILKMAESGADLIEIGIPFSDPIAEGKVIEAANMRALSAGATTDKVFEMVKRLRTKTEIPLVFLTYLNPVFSRGYENFFGSCKEAGVDGIIIPDLPYEEHGELLDIAGGCGVKLISMVAPTSEERIAEIAKRAQGFIYLVSSMGVTGVRSEIKTDLRAMTEIIKSVTEVPVCVGFGISTPQQASEIAAYADGIIVGSAMVRMIEANGDTSAEILGDYVKSMKEAAVKEA